MYCSDTRVGEWKLAGPILRSIPSKVSLVTDIPQPKFSRLWGMLVLSQLRNLMKIALVNPRISQLV